MNHISPSRLFPAKKALAIILAIALSVPSTAVYANGFIPTMVSANVLWLAALAPIVAIEGWLMNRWAWEKPYKSALIGNILSMLAALPLGLLFSKAGMYLGTIDWKTTFPYVSDSARNIIVQSLVYGELPLPFNQHEWTWAGVSLAALIFIGLCWSFTFVIEGGYYSRKNPTRPRIEILRRTALANTASYYFLIAIWMPYLFHSYNLQRIICDSNFEENTAIKALINSHVFNQEAAKLPSSTRLAFLPGSTTIHNKPSVDCRATIRVSIDEGGHFNFLKEFLVVGRNGMDLSVSPTLQQ